MYSPRLDVDTKETAEESVFIMVMQRSPRMTAAKREKLEYVVKGVMARYRYMHQGGQSANEDPLASPEGFRAWMDAHYGVALDSRNWERDWGDVIRVSFECCEDLDRDALSRWQRQSTKCAGPLEALLRSCAADGMISPS